MSSCDPTYGHSETDAAKGIIDGDNPKAYGEECDLLHTAMADGDHELVEVQLKASPLNFQEDRLTFVTRIDVTEFLSGDEANVSLIHVYIM